MEFSTEISQHKNLEGRDFSGCDLRGKNFSGCNLKKAIFQDAKLGLSKTGYLFIETIFIFVCFLSGLIGGFGGASISHILLEGSNATLLLGVISLLFLVLFFIVIIWKGLEITISTLLEIIATFLIVSIASFPDNETGSNLLSGSILTILGLIGVIAAVGNLAFSVSVGRLIHISQIKIKAILLTSIAAIIGIGLGVRETSYVLALYKFIISFLIAISTISLGFYVGWKAIGEGEKYKVIRYLAIALVSKFGTRFNHADLTDADFSDTPLFNCDFSGANLKRTNFAKAKGLETSRLNQTYLARSKIRQLVTTKEANGQIFDYLDLQGINIKGANLQYASFIDANLSNTTLENTNLLGAKLVATQLYNSNLKEAVLTGAYIENWAISTDTQLDRIKCDYIYMRNPTPEDPDPCRKPDDNNETFSEGDFTNFIAPIIKTLDLYHQQNVDMRQVVVEYRTLDFLHKQGLDPQAAAIALAQVQENYPDAELEVLALEGRGEGNIRIQAKVGESIDRSLLSQEYFQLYKQLQESPSLNIQSLLVRLESREEEISRLTELLSVANKQPRFYIENAKGDIVNDKKETNIKVEGGAGFVAAGDIKDLNFQGTMNLGTISGNVTNTINQLPEPQENSEQVNIKQLLLELQTTIEQEPEVNDEEKGDFLEAIRTLAEAALEFGNQDVTKVAKSSLRMMKGMLTDFPSNAQIVKCCTEILPLVAMFFGL